MGERSERTTVFANPDGFTFTLEESAVPVRVERPGGGWQAPDATLEQRRDGSVGPKAAAAQMTFSSGGGKDPLVSIADGDRSLALEWPGKLPKPELDGTSALYREVLLDVDLKVTATVESFQHVLIVKSPKAASDKRLRKLTFGLRTKGLSVRKGAAGNLAAVDASGQTVFRAPPAQMWDSAGKSAKRPTTRSSPQARAQAPSGAAPALGDASETAASGTGLAPGQGDRVARMGVQVGKSSLAVVPDAAMLTATPASAFPLFIDPTVTWGESERTQLRSDGYESYGWTNGSDNMGQGVGKCGSWNGYYCGPGYVQRLYFEFSPASLKGKKVLDATFRVTEPWSFQCDPRWVDLVRTNNISSATTWSSRPAELDLMVDRNVSAGRGSLCDSPESPTAPIEFNDNPAETNENLTPTVRDFAAGKFSRLTLQLRAHDETDTSAWKRFRNDAVLAVKYVGLPALPKDVGLVAGSGHVCSTGEYSPSVVSDPTPLVTGRPQTAAGGESGANLRIRWHTERWNGSSWVAAHAAIDSPTSGYVGNLVKQSRSLPVLSEGVKYRLRALTISYYEDGSNSAGSGYTAPCYFTVDTTAPKAPQVTIGSPYSECTPSACIGGGGPGVLGKFTLKAADGDTDNVAYQYRSSNDESWKDATKICSPSTPDVLCAKYDESSIFVRGWRATVTPDRSGTYLLYARAQDKLGRWGAQHIVEFLVAPGEGPVARWRFDEASGAAVDSSSGGSVHSAILASGASRDDRGRRGLMTHGADGVELAAPVTDKGLAVDGSTGYASTSGPVLETRSSYTVSAWVWVDPSTTKTVSVLSQTPTSSPWSRKYSPFVISYGGRWSLRVFSTEGTWAREAMAPNPSPKGVWTHVAGVHDAEAKKVHMYVNGKLEATVDAGTPAAADGPMEIGRVMYADNYLDHFNGSIDEVAVWQRTLTAQEIAGEARLLTSSAYAGTELIAHWDASGVSGTTVNDTTSGYGKSLTLTGGPTVENEAIVLDGADDAATVAGPLVDDTGSFTVTTAVQLDSAKLLVKGVGYTGQVLGQRTADGSSWGFWYQVTGTKPVFDEETFEETTVPVGFWHFGRLNADGTFSSVISEEAAALDSIVRLTGIHDAQSGTISLYLGHNPNGEPKAYTAKLGTGEFALGKGYTSGGWQHHLPARIADVRLWSGAMASPQQVESHVGD
nr:LamG domain-containing protein [Streptomyces sp. TRM64462]